MSYILDALRKADAERDRGNVPGIHAQPLFGGVAPSGARPAAQPWLWVGAGALAALLIGALAWYVTRSAVVPAVPAPIVAPPAPVAVVPTPVPPPIEAATPKATPAPATRKPRPIERSATPKVDAKPAAPAASAVPGERVYAVNELPDDIRRQLPAVNVGGSMYSASKADRILIINGQVLHEGDAIAPGLTLQQIKLKAAVLAFKGYRYSIAF